MATLILRPDADTFVNNFTPQGGGDNYVEVDEVSADEDTTYNYATGTARIDYYDLPASGLGAVTIDQIELFTRCRCEGTTGSREFRNYLRVDGTNNNGDLYTNVGTAYVDRGMVWVNNPATGVAWVVDDFDSLQFLIGLRTRFLDDVLRITQCWVVITYTPAAAAGGILAQVI